MPKITPYTKAEVDEMVGALEAYVAIAKRAKKELEHAAREFLVTQAQLKTTGQCPRRLTGTWADLTSLDRSNINAAGSKKRESNK